MKDRKKTQIKKKCKITFSLFCYYFNNIHSDKRKATFLQIQFPTHGFQSYQKKATPYNYHKSFATNRASLLVLGISAPQTQSHLKEKYPLAFYFYRKLSHKYDINISMAVIG